MAYNNTGHDVMAPALGHHHQQQAPMSTNTGAGAGYNTHNSADLEKHDIAHSHSSDVGANGASYDDKALGGPHIGPVVNAHVENISARAVEYAKHGHQEEGFDLAPIDAAAERRLVRKIDLRVMPMLILIYLCNFIDRSNIGNARAAGLATDLKLVGFQYNAALTTYYVVYGIFNLPANLILKRVGPSWLAFLTLTFGAVSLGTAFITTFGQLIATRVLLGICEGGTLPGVAYILTRYYTRGELVMRISFYLAGSAAMAGGFGGLLASAFLVGADPSSSVTTWRKIFFYEGLITMAIGLAGFVLLPGEPEKSKIWTEEERVLILARMERQQIGTHVVREPTTIRGIINSINLHSFICGMGYCLTNVSVQGLSLFMPTIIATLGNYTTVQVQLRSVPPYVLGFFWTLVIAYLGIRFKVRAFILMLSTLFSIAGYGIFVGSLNSDARYAACFLGFMGAVPCGPIWLSWGADNAAPDTMRAIVTGFIPAVGTIGSVVATWSYLPTDAPNYPIGNKLNVGCTCANFALALVGWLYLTSENKKRAAGKRDHILQGKTQLEVERLGWRHPRFVMQT